MGIVLGAYLFSILWVNFLPFFPTSPPDHFEVGFSLGSFQQGMYPFHHRPLKEKLLRWRRDLEDLGIDTLRPAFPWSEIEPLILYPQLTRKAITEEMVASYARGGSGIHYDTLDPWISLLHKRGVSIIGVLGIGYTQSLPFVLLDGKRVRLTPDLVGRERYLALLTLHARGVVRHYRGKVVGWQLENELNVAGETQVWGWRKGKAWHDKKFLTAIIRTLHDAVKKEDPAAFTTHNFHTDLKLLPLFYDWRRDVTHWLPYLDVVGIDIYANYFFGLPLTDRVVGRRVYQARRAARGKPVMVLESGYPSKPRWRGFTEKRQAAYLEKSVRAARAAGAEAFYYFTFTSREDASYLTTAPFPFWSKFLQAVEPWWGIKDKNNTKKPSFRAFQQIMAAQNLDQKAD